MPFKKGVSGNAKGRKKNQPNKVTGQLRETLKTALAGELESLTSLLSECEPTARLELMIKLLVFVLPKASTTESAPANPSTDTAVLISSTLERLQAGIISPESASVELKAIDCLLRNKELNEIENKLIELESKIGEISK